MTGRGLILTVLCFLAVPQITVAGATPQRCPVGRQGGGCGAVAANRQTGNFRGLLAVSRDSSLLNEEADTTGSDGCAHCEWTVLEDCPHNAPTATSQVDCTGAHNDPACRRNQVADRFYLSTPEFQYRDEGVYCIGGANRIVPVGEDAVADVNRYLKNVTPPDLRITFDPGTSLAGLATKVTAAPPNSLKPAPFGGPAVTETITIRPTKESFAWGDGTSANLTAKADGTARTTHTYTSGGHQVSAIRTTWGASYTIAYGGRTFGPYRATGTLTKLQRRALTVVTSTPVLVSHG